MSRRSISILCLAVFTLTGCSVVHHSRGFERMEMREHQRSKVGNAGDETHEVLNAAEQFAREDPFILEGLIKSFVIRDWNDTMLE